MSSMLFYRPKETLKGLALIDTAIVHVLSKLMLSFIFILHIEFFYY